MFLKKHEKTTLKHYAKIISKAAHNRPRPFFSVLARLPKRPKNRNPVPPKAPNAGLGI